MPLATFSKPITPASTALSWPCAASSAKPRLLAAISTRLTSTDTRMPKRLYIAPPMKMPMSNAKKPTPTSYVPIWSFVNFRSSSNRRNVRFASVSPILCSSTNSSTSQAPLRRKNSTNGWSTAASRGPTGGARWRDGSPSQAAATSAGRTNAMHATYAQSQPARAATNSASAPAAAEPIRQPYCDMPEPTPSCRGSSVSIRNASITMSNVAPLTPTAMAAIATRRRSVAGSASPSQATLAATATAESSSQDTRWPRRPSSGRRRRSTSGAQNTFRL